ncbi:MAG: hypothetical protein J6R88_01600, partial [Clostridia bacterium]|nr:hypothetical protein [Clostridia bacterium]
IGDDVIVDTEGKGLLNEVKNSKYNDYGFSYDVLRVTNMVIDDSAYSSSYMMNTYVELNEDDAFIVTDSEGDGLYENYVSNYYAIEIYDYINLALKYVTENGFVNENGEFNEDKIRANFEKTRGNDSRFETSKLFNDGLKEEINRIKAVYKNAVVLKKVLANHPELLYKKEQVETNVNGVKGVKEGYFALNLSALNGNGSNVISNAFYRKVVVDEESGDVEYTTSGIVLMIGNNYNSNYDLDYESLALINKIISKYSTFIEELNVNEIPEI